MNYKKKPLLELLFPKAVRRFPNAVGLRGMATTDAFKIVDVRDLERCVSECNSFTDSLKYYPIFLSLACGRLDGTLDSVSALAIQAPRDVPMPAPPSAILSANEESWYVWGLAEPINLQGVVATGRDETRAIRRSAGYSDLKMVETEIERIDRLWRAVAKKAGGVALPCMTGAVPWPSSWQIRGQSPTARSQVTGEVADPAIRYALKDCLAWA